MLKEAIGARETRPGMAVPRLLSIVCALVAQALERLGWGSLHYTARAFRSRQLTPSGETNFNRSFSKDRPGGAGRFCVAYFGAVSFVAGFKVFNFSK